MLPLLLPCLCCDALQIDMIRTAAEPYTQSVRKVSKRLSMAAEDAFVRMSAGPASRTKSHFRAE